MNLDFSDKGKLKILMVPFLKKTTEEFPEWIMGSAATPSTDQLFDVRDDSERKLLEEEQARALCIPSFKLLNCCLQQYGTNGMSLQLWHSCAHACGSQVRMIGASSSACSSTYMLRLHCICR